MNTHKLLEKQIRKYFTPEYLENEHVKAFLNAVNDSYHAYERGQALSDHAFRISELEYIDINQRLKEEINLKEKGLNTLKEVIKNLEDSADITNGENSDNLISILASLNKYIERRKKMEAELRRLSLVASLNEQGVIFTEPSGVITWANEGFSRLTGYSMEEIIGKTPLELCKGELSQRTSIKDMVDAFSTGKTFNIEVIHYRKDGSWFWGKARGQAIADDQGTIRQYFAIVEDITPEKNAEELLKKNEEKYRGIISNMNLGLLEVDLDDKIQFANNSFCEMSGYRFSELVGRQASKLFMKEENLLSMEGKHEMRLRGISDAYEMEVRNRAGETRWWLISGAPQYNDQGEVTGSVGIHLDITEQKNLQQDFIEAREQAEESSRAKESFLANMSHEIRTPMNAILGMGRQLGKTSLDRKQRLYLDTINSAAENLLVVINDILDISKIEAGKLAIENIGFRMKDVIARVTRVMLHKAEERGIRLTWAIDEGLHPVLLGDPYRLNQVLLNMVSNAIKFTEKGSVTVRCFRKVRKGGRETVCIQVIDTGIGMDEVFLKNLFQKFLQEDRSVVRKYGGTGLGMSITKQLVELMQGTIEVRSIKGKGTEIILDIPLMPGTATDLPAKEELSSDATILQGKQILLAEDNEMNRLVAITVLNNYGAVVAEAVNGVEAIEALKQKTYDLVLMDVQMPVMDGLEASRIIRESMDKNIPIIALTANAIKGENDKCLAAGMNDYVSKPFEEEELIKIIANWLGKEPAVSLAAPVHPEAGTLYRLEKLEKLGQGNQAFVNKMLSLFISEVPATIQSISNAYKTHDFATVKAMAHRVKPVLDSLCIDSLRDDIRAIEQATEADMPSSRMEEMIRKLEQVIAIVVADLQQYIKKQDQEVA